MDAIVPSYSASADRGTRQSLKIDCEELPAGRTMNDANNNCCVSSYHIVGYVLLWFRGTLSVELRPHNFQQPLRWKTIVTSIAYTLRMINDTPATLDQRLLPIEWWSVPALSH